MSFINGSVSAIEPGRTAGPKRGARLWLNLALGILGLALSPAIASADLTFAPPTFPGGGSQAVAVADFNDDGRSDLVTGSWGCCVQVLLGRGDGSFSPATPFMAAGVPDSVAVADFNRDGDTDVAAGIDGSDDVLVLLGTGDGSLGLRQRFDAGGGQSSVAAGDLDHDGIPDLAVTTSGAVKVLLGDGSGRFGPAESFDAGPGLRSVKIADLNDNGYPDLAVASSGSNQVSVLLGNGDGTFGAATGFDVGEGPTSIAVADLDNDGIRDLASAGFEADQVSVLLGEGGGSFAVAVGYPVGDGPHSVTAGDVDGDNVRDLVTANDGSGDVSVLRGAGDGSFESALDFAVSAHPEAAAIGQLNRDGAPDVATASNAEGVSVLLNAPRADPDLAALGFGSPTPVPRGTLSAPQTVNLTNNGSAPLHVSGFAFSGANPDDFTTGADTCHAPIAAGDACSVKVRFAPQAKGVRAATLTALTNAAEDPTVELSGTAGPLPRGPQGPRGPRGPRGPAGRNAKVNCAVRDQGQAGIRVICRVRLVGRRSAKLRWRVTKRHRTVTHGVLFARDGRARLRLSGAEGLRRGRYVLHVAGRKRGIAFVVR